jgi:hypothetical protein
MRMIKKYWWLIALAALAYWKWDMVSTWLGIKPKDATIPQPKPAGFYPPTEEDAAKDVIYNSGADAAGDGVPDILQGLI